MLPGILLSKIHQTLQEKMHTDVVHKSSACRQGPNILLANDHLFWFGKKINSKLFPLLYAYIYKRFIVNVERSKRQHIIE